MLQWSRAGKHRSNPVAGPTLDVRSLSAPKFEIASRISERRRDLGRAFHGAMNRATVSDRQKSTALRLVERALETDLAREMIDPRARSVGVPAVFTVGLFVREPNFNSFEWPPLAIRVHAEGDRGAGPESGRQ